MPTWKHISQHKHKHNNSVLPFSAPTSLITRDMRTPQRHSLLEDPLLRLNALFVLIISWWNPIPLQRLQLRMIDRSHKVHNAIPRPLPLLARRRDDAMSAATQHAVRELDGSVTKVDDGAALLRLHPEPFPWHVGLKRAEFTGGFGPDLKAAEPVH